MLDKEIIKRIKNMSESELTEALSVAKGSDAPHSLKEEYIKAIESAMGVKYASAIAINNYYEALPVISDIQ